MEKKYYYHYFITMLTTIILLFKEQFDDLYALYFPNINVPIGETDKTLEKIQEIIGTVFTDHPRKVLLIKHLSPLIYTFLVSEEKKELTVYLQMNKAISGNYPISNRLKQIFNDQFLQITEKPEHADLIITDWFEPQQQTAEIFYFDPTKEHELWQNLLHLIQQLHQS